MTTRTKEMLTAAAMFTICGGLITAATSAAKILFSLPKARHLFGISVAPTGHALLLYSSAEAPEGEVTSGTAVLLKLNASPEVLPLAVPPATDDLTPAVWEKGGRGAYILTSAGIYFVKAETGSSKLIVRGALAGLAISPDDSRLAFWNLGSSGTQYTLSVVDIESKRTLRTWKVPTLFDSDQYGHEIVFSSNGSSLFARTYDEENRTPLEQFDIAHGAVHTVWPDCAGLARSSDDVYFIGNDRGVSTLFKLGQSSVSPRRVVAPFRFDSLMSGGTQRWVVAVNNRSRALAVLDSETDRLSRMPSWCESVGGLGNGQLVCSRGADLVLTDAPSLADGR